MTKRTLAFLSYSWKNHDWVAALHQALSSRFPKCEFFFDARSIDYGSSLHRDVPNELVAAEHLIVVTSPESMTSEWVRNEIAAFQSANKDWGSRKRILVIDLVPCEKLPFLADLKAFDFTSSEKVANGFPALEAALRKGTRKPSESVAVPVELGQLPAALNSKTWDEVVRCFAKILDSHAHRSALGVEIDEDDRSFLLTGESPRHAAQSAWARISRRNDELNPVEITEQLIELAHPVFDDRPTLEKALAELSKSLETVTRAAIGNDELARYRQSVRRDHNKLIDWFKTAATRTLDRVHVRIDLETLALEAKRGIENRQRCTLRSLLDFKPDPDLGISGHWQVFGEPGAGKSTIARHLAWQLAGDPRGAVPIYVSLARCVAKKAHPINFVVEELASTLPRADSSTLKERLAQRLTDLGKSGKLVFLLDGLDEIPTEGDLQDTAKKLVTSLADEFADSHVIVLSRPHDSLRIGAPFATANLCRLGPGEQKELLVNLLGEVRSIEVQGQLERNARLAELASNPLLLTMIAALVLDDRTPPSNRVQLYSEVIDMLLEVEWRDGRAKRSEDDTAPLRHWLARLALRLQCSATPTWTDRELTTELKGAKDDASKGRNAGVDFPWKSNSEFFTAVDTVLGPFEGPREKRRFLHRQFREFLAAERLLELGQKHCLERAKKLEDDDLPQWSEVFAFVAAKSERPLEFLKALREVSAPLVLRALPDVDGVAPSELLALLMDTDGWEYVDLWRLASALPHGTEAEREAIRALLWPYVGKLGDTDRLAYLHLTFVNLGIVVDREAFFTACERPIVDAPSIEWAKIPAGSFAREQDGVSVSIPAFELAKTVITRAQYRAFDPDHESTKWKLPQGESDDDLPVTDVSWWSAYLYCAWMDARLPSEWEWEYACRAESTTAYWFGNDEKDLADHAWYSENSGRRLHVVADPSKKANPFGLSDMHGNVWEWCRDAWNDYVKDAPVDGSARCEDASPNRVYRGGSFWYTADRLRSAIRDWFGAGGRGSGLGFRPARPLPA